MAASDAPIAAPVTASLSLTTTESPVGADAPPLDFEQPASARMAREEKTIAFRMSGSFFEFTFTRWTSRKRIAADFFLEEGAERDRARGDAAREFRDGLREQQLRGRRGRDA